MKVVVELEGRGSHNACDTVVVARDGYYQERLQGSAGNDGVCHFTGAGERAGNYVVESTYSGYPSNVQTTLVQRDACHVIPKDLSVILSKPPIDTVCLAVVFDALEVTVNLDAAHELNACDASVVASDGDYQETLSRHDTSNESTSTCRYRGAIGRHGFYQVTASIGALEPQVSSINVLTDTCNVIPESVEFVFGVTD